jgi:di/tricarboxylate transporter
MSSGATKWLASVIFSFFGLQTMSVVVVMIIVMLVCQFMHFLFVGTTVMATALLPMVLSLGNAAGYPPELLTIPAAMIIGGYPVLMFYCTNPNILVYGTDQLKVSDFPKVGIPIAIIACLLYALCAATYWHWIGFI